MATPDDNDDARLGEELGVFGLSDTEIETLSDRLDSIQPSLEARFNETESQTPERQMVKSRETALTRLRSAIRDAPRSC